MPFKLVYNFLFFCPCSLQFHNFFLGGGEANGSIIGVCIEALTQLLARLYNIYSAGILKQYMAARNRVGIGLSYRPARAPIF
jgi:hypothetical protein